MAEVDIWERIRARDLEWLIETTGETGTDPSDLRRDARRLVELSEHPAAAAALLRDSVEPFPAVAPALVFLVLVSHTLRALRSHRFVAEPVSGTGDLPVFDADELRSFAADPSRRLFLADLLASFVHLESGVRWVLSRTGWRRQRYSDLDPVSVAQRLADATGAERHAALRRLGDVSLFLSGIFPEHARDHPLEARRLERIRRLLAAASARPVEGPGEIVLTTGGVRGVWLLEWLGRQAYELAAETALPDDARLIGDVARRFRVARRTLNAVASLGLGGLRGRWFPVGGPA